jgi:hypothetical protein
MKKRILAGAIIVIGSASAYAMLYQPVANAVVGVTAHTICSDHFITGLSPDRIWAESLQPIGPIATLKPQMDIQVDDPNKLVKVTSVGSSRTAYFTPGRGCTLLKRMPPLPSVASAQPIIKWDPSFASNTAVVARHPGLSAAIADAFDASIDDPRGTTRAIVIVHDGKIIAEHYGKGIGLDTPLNGYSVSKSVNATLIAMLADRGKLQVSDQSLYPNWRQENDPRRRITIDHLLRMVSGLDLAENHSGLDPVTRMWFSEPDMVAFASEAKLNQPPNSVFRIFIRQFDVANRLGPSAIGRRAECSA